MNTSETRWSGWTHAGIPLHTGNRPSGAMTLAELVDTSLFLRVLPELTALAGSQRQGALTALHYAAHCLTYALTGPLVIDGVVLSTDADSLGLLLDVQAQPQGVWVRHVDVRSHDFPLSAVDREAAGAIAMRLLRPLLVTVSRAAGVTLRGTSQIAIDALANGYCQIQRSAGIALDMSAVGDYIAGMAEPTYVRARPLAIQPDDGPPVDFFVPKLCCVLYATPGPHACPTCPQRRSDDDRRTAAVEWLHGMTNDEFQRVTGRARVQFIPLGDHHK